MRKMFARIAFLALATVLVLTACGGKAPATQETVGGFQIPEIVEGKFNVAMVLIGPHDDGGWSQAHYEGLLYVEENVDDVHVAYIENVPEGADSEQVFRSLARKGFDVIFGTSFGYMDPMETVAGEYPDITFIHVSGYKSNGTNFGNLFGAMEDMKYLAGMVAGSRAKLDGNPRLGYMATFPIPEELRLGNAFMLGAKRTCPECTMDVRWINTWHDPVAEKDAAASLFDAGAQVVLTGADTPAVADVAQEKGRWGITYDYIGSCKVERCLTTIYWNWGPVYASVIEGVRDGTYQVGWDYFDADTGSLGLYGFMEGQTLTVGEADLPAADLQLVRDTLAAMLAGDFTRFDVFAGPISDNQGNVIVPAGEVMTQADLDQFPPGAEGLECQYCMYWWAEGITAELPSLTP
jgi:basic membrane protein A and related proteins